MVCKGEPINKVLSQKLAPLLNANAQQPCETWKQPPSVGPCACEVEYLEKADFLSKQSVVLDQPTTYKAYSQFKGEKREEILKGKWGVMHLD